MDAFVNKPGLHLYNGGTESPGDQKLCDIDSPIGIPVAMASRATPSRTAVRRSTVFSFPLAFPLCRSLLAVLAFSMSVVILESDLLGRLGPRA